MTEAIRKARSGDLSRIAEILVFVKRMKYRPIFQNDAYSFGELQVLPVAAACAAPEVLEYLWVYDDGIVKGVMHVHDGEVVQLYVDYFFQGRGVGGALLEYAKAWLHVSFLWALEKNPDAIRFYEGHGFRLTGDKKLEEDTPEYLVRLEWTGAEKGMKGAPEEDGT